MSAPFRLVNMGEDYWLNPYAVGSIFRDPTDGKTKIAFVGGAFAESGKLSPEELARRINAFVSANELLERNGQMPTPEEERGAE